MISLTSTMDLGIADAGIIALLGYAVVFFGLILLMLVVMALGRSFTAKKNPKASIDSAPVPPAAPATSAPAAQAAPVSGDAAPGSAGKLKLHNVPPKTAAMLMAIVANKMGKPLNELRFTSIKEVEK